MTNEDLAILADDIADMHREFIDARDYNSLKNMASNLANMIRAHGDFHLNKQEVKYLVDNIQHEYLNKDTYEFAINLFRRMEKFLEEK